MRVLGFAMGVLALVGCALAHAPVPAEGEPPMAANRSPDSSVDTEPASGIATEPDTLTLAAECLERGDQAGAATHLECYVCRHPDQLMFRLQLAEMLLRLDRDVVARAHYERFAADAQSATGPVRGQLVNAHTRLMEIAQRGDDRFGELFHRGVGLLLLTREQEKQTPGDADPAFAEEMLCKALLALKEARELKPSDSRTRSYLAEVYERCGNRRAAEAERAGIRNALLPGELTPSERRNCPISCQVGR